MTTRQLAGFDALLAAFETACQAPVRPSSALEDGYRLLTEVESHRDSLFRNVLGPDSP